jgi:2,3-bisphosphoglycerate-dependent phosphoglycerate mutase
MVLENISEGEITEIEIPTGIPYRLSLDAQLTVLAANYLGDPEAATKAAEVVRRQAG